MKSINSFNELLENVKDKEKAFVLLFKSASESSECSLNNLKQAYVNSEIPVFIVNVNEVRDIHINYGVVSVPALLIFEKGEFINLIKGCQSKEFYEGLFSSALYRSKAKAEGKEPKRVTVYSTPTCTWCNTLKSWLRKNGIPFTDIDVSGDRQAAEQLVRTTGQQGVPQTEINGNWVIGFDQKRLRELLEI